MPSHRVHRAIDRLVLGRELPHVHRFKDKPYKVLGRRHRVVFHDPDTNIILGLLFGPEAMVSGFLHDLADQAESLARKRRRGWKK